MTDYWLVVSPPYLAIRDERHNARRKEHILIDDKLKITSIECIGLIHYNLHEIPIVIDPTILTLNDEKVVKQAVWEIVKSEIGKQTINIKGRTFAVPPNEPKELAPIYRCYQKTFENHLKWYDQWTRGLRFRRITYIELTFNDPAKREELFRKYSNAKNITVITSSMPDDLRLSITSKENAVRKGVDLIYYAIHRTRRSAENPPKK